MTTDDVNSLATRVLVLAPTARDGEVTSELMLRGGFVRGGLPNDF